jgi:MFS family permease
MLMFGYSLLEGVGTALLIPPVYILRTVSFLDPSTRAKAFGAISAAAGIGAATGPLVGGIITTAISWRATFTLQVLIVVLIIVLSLRISDPGIQGARPKFDFVGTILSAAGLVFVVLGILQSGTYGWVTANQNFTIGNTVIIPKGGISPVWLFVGIGVLFLVRFFLWIRSRERAGKEALLSTHLFRNRTSNLGLVTQFIQWFILLGSSFVISVFLQQVLHYNAIQTGLTLTPVTIGILVTGSIAGRLAKRFTQKTLIWTGFVATITGLILLFLLGRLTSNILATIPGLLLGVWDWE